MEIVTKEILNNFVGVYDSICISIYMPTFKKGNETEQNSIRFKNRITKAEKILEGTKENDDGRLSKNLDLAKEYIEDTNFWEHQSNGFCMFISPDNFQYLRLPVDFEELVVVSRRFHMKPILSMLGSNRHYMLALSRKSAQLFNCTEGGIDKVEVDNLPENVEEVLDKDELEKHLQFHTETPQIDSGGGRPAIFHGTGAGDIDKDVYTLKYFREIDNALSNYLANEKVPLVLACVDFLLPLYEKANNYHYLFQENISGNPESFTDEELHNKSFDLLKSYFQKDKHESIENYNKLFGQKSDLQSNDLSEILIASFFGRIETLLVAKNLQKWGTFNRENFKIFLADKKGLESEDLLDLAAIYTFINSGKVFVLDSDKMPESSDINAIFRY